MTTDQKQYLQEIIRREFDRISNSSKPIWMADQEAEELYALCIELELDNSFIDEMKKDAKVK